jgi:hypothetical protein
VKVLNCAGSGTTAGIVQGIDWVTQQHAAGAPAVANMSLGGSADVTLAAAVRLIAVPGSGAGKHRELLQPTVVEDGEELRRRACRKHPTLRRVLAQLVDCHARGRRVGQHGLRVGRGVMGSPRT